MSNMVFGPAELLRYMGMGSEQDIAAGNAQLKSDIAGMTAAPPMGAPPMGSAQAPSPAVAMVAQAMPAANPQFRQRPNIIRPNGMSGIMGIPTPFGR